MRDDLIDQLRGWQESESMSDDARRKLWLMRKAADEIERLRGDRQKWAPVSPVDAGIARDEKAP